MEEDSRLKWTPDHIKFFLECCVEEVTNHGRNGNTLKKHSWVNVVKKMKESFKKPIEQKQLKNQYDYLRKRYFAWATLKNKTGNNYDPAKNTFTLSNEEWNVLAKKNGNIKSLKTSQLLFPELCAAVFDKTYATGARARSVSSSHVSGASSSIPSLQLQDEEDDDDDFDESIHDVQSIPSLSMPTLDEGPSKPKKKQKKEDKLDILIEKAASALDSVVATNPQPVSECVAKLKTIGLNELNPLYLAAYEIFGHSGILRDTWMCLPENPKL